MSELSVLSYNIHKGFSIRNRHLIINQLRDAIRQTGADMLFLQEVIGEHALHQEDHPDWPTEKQFEYLADSVWPHYAYGKNAVYDAGHHGNAILSKFPIVRHENLDISGGQFEQRGILFCQVELPGKNQFLDCYCTHLGLFGRVRDYQFTRICDFIEKTSRVEDRLLLAGDFNDWQQRACRMLEEKLSVSDAHRKSNGFLARTFPSRFPVLKLDRVYSRGFEIKSATALRGRPWSVLSDHVPLLVRLALGV